MASALGFLVVGIIVVALVCIAIKVIVALLPVALAIGVVGMLGLAFCENTCATQSEPVKTHVEKIDKYVEDAKDAAEDVGRTNEHQHVQLRSGTYDKTVAFNKQETTAF